MLGNVIVAAPDLDLQVVSQRVSAEEVGGEDRPTHGVHVPDLFWSIDDDYPRSHPEE